MVNIKSKGAFLIALVSIFQSFNTLKVCTNCYVQKNSRVQFACDNTKCDVFLWPKDKTLPMNIECKIQQNNVLESNCYILQGLDPSAKYHKFIKLNSFASKESVSLFQNTGSDINFKFQELSNGLKIVAEFEDSSYQGKMSIHPDIKFQDVQQALKNHEYKIVSKGAQALKIKIGFYTLELKNILHTTINQLKNTLSQLQAKLNPNNSDSAKTLERFKKLETENYQLKSEISKLNKRLNDFTATSNSLKSQVQLANKQFNQLNTRLVAEENFSADFKNAIGTINTSVTELKKISQDSTKNSTETGKKIVAIQQRVNSNDATANKLRQMISTYEAGNNRKILHLENSLEGQKNLTLDLYNLIQNVSNTTKSFINPELLSSFESINVSTNYHKQSNSTQNNQLLSMQKQLITKEFSIAQLSRHSKVATKQQQTSALQSFFHPRQVSKVQLLYRASEHEFLTSIFHKLCDKIPDTLVLFQTQYNKKIGGFTPLLWDGTKNGEYKTDNTNQSFTFSLSNKDKFVLNQKEKAICNHFNYGPIFGSGADFSICDQANEKPLSYVDISRSYFNPNYKQRDRESWEKFCGNTNNSWHFKIKEWQVWRVEFKNPSPSGDQNFL